MEHMGHNNGDIGDNMTMTPSMSHHDGAMMMDRMNDSVHHHVHDMIGDIVTQMTHDMHRGMTDHMSHEGHDMMNGNMNHGMTGDMMATHDMLHGDMHDMHGDMHGGHMMHMPNSFFFSKRTNDLIFQGWTPTTDNQFILVFICIILAALLMEAGRRVTRELYRKITQIDKQLYIKSCQPSAKAAPHLCSPPHANGSSRYSSRKPVNQGRDETIPLSKELNGGNQTRKTAKVWKMNQEGFLQLKTDNTNCSTDGQSPGNCARHTSAISWQDSQVASLKRNLSFDLGGNRWNTFSEENCHLDNEKVVPMSDRRKLGLKRLLFHSLVTVSHVGQVVLGYILMLVVMSYNVWLLLAVLTGAAFGYLLFSWDRIILNRPSYIRVPRVEAVLTSSV